MAGYQVSPLRGSNCFVVSPLPWAHAHGYQLSCLRHSFFIPLRRDAACRVSSKAESPAGAEVDSRGREPTVQNTGNKKTEPRRGGTWQGTRCRPCGARVVLSSHPLPWAHAHGYQLPCLRHSFFIPPCRDAARCVVYPFDIFTFFTPLQPPITTLPTPTMVGVGKALVRPW